MLDNFGIKFASKCLKKYYEMAVAPKITNDWYEGQIRNGRADRLKIKTVTESQGLQTYTPGTALILGSLTDVEASLIPNQRKAYCIKVVASMAKAVMKNWENCWKPLGAISIRTLS